MPSGHLALIITSQQNLQASVAGLPDLSWYKIPKREKYTKLPRTLPNVHKI
jgi:hypothetical protein